MTLLITSIAPHDLVELSDRAARAWSLGAEAIEIRLDAFDDPPETVAAYLREHADKTWVVTCRSVAEGGASPLVPADRADLILTASAGTNAILDFEFADWKSSEQARQALSELTVAGDEGHHRLILSAHDFSGMLHDPAARLLSIGSDPVRAIAKLSYRAQHACDSFAALDLLQHEIAANTAAERRRIEADGRGVIAIAMGEDGMWTRVLAKKLGAFASYTALQTQDATAPGQLTLHDMIEVYRWNRIDADTRVFGVVGDPVGHSMSPVLFNHWFEAMSINAVYVPMLVRTTGGCIRAFLDGVRSRAWLGVGGFSITIPHKPAALEWAGDGAERVAQRIGAANTLCLADDGVRAYNTDCYAAIDSMADALERSRTELNGLRVDVLGTGGAAAALVYSLPTFGCDVTVFGRSPDRTRRLAEPFGARAASWDERAKSSGDVLVNCTSVGMLPKTNESPMPHDALAARQLVFDVIYNPLQTQLLSDADAAGVKTLNGLDMFVRQARMQFELWFERTPDVSSARSLIETGIARQGAT